MRDTVVGIIWGLVALAGIFGLLFGLAAISGRQYEEWIQREREKNCASFRGTPGFEDCLRWAEPD